jgi:hypothetical protein
MYVGLVARGRGTNVAGYLFLGRKYLVCIVRRDPFRTPENYRWRSVVDNLCKLGITGLMSGRAVVGTLPAPKTVSAGW